MDEVYSFYKKYYSSNIMSVVVYSKETLPRLEFLVKQEFNKLQNNHILVNGPKVKSDQPALSSVFQTEKLGQMIRLKINQA